MTLIHPFFSAQASPPSSWSLFHGTRTGSQGHGSQRDVRASASCTCLCVRHRTYLLAAAHAVTLVARSPLPFSTRRCPSPYRHAPTLSQGALSTPALKTTPRTHPPAATIPHTQPRPGQRPHPHQNSCARVCYRAVPAAPPPPPLSALILVPRPPPPPPHSPQPRTHSCTRPA